MELRPLPESRVAGVIPGASLALLSGIAVVDPVTWLPVPLTVVGVVLGTFLAVRGYRLAVICDQHGVMIQGFLRTRTVPRQQVTGVDEGIEMPVLHWQDDQGRRSRSPIASLWTSGRMLRRYREHARRDLDRLRRWVRPGGTRNRRRGR